MTTLPSIVRTAAELRSIVAAWKAAGARIALIPTMGALHRGHLSHIPIAASRADKIVVSIFVNPAQFAPHEDFDRYPRNLSEDSAMLAVSGLVNAIYAPAAEEIYPAGFATKIAVDGPGVGLESDYRPHFFTGVATVVARLIRQCQPDFATFGEKDYQQLLVVKRLALDLALDVEIIGVPTMREADGLALSSRNAYLNPAQRSTAAQLNSTLAHVAERARQGVSFLQAEAEGAARLIEAGFDRVDYIAIRDAATLAPIGSLAGPGRVLGAARLGAVRLIDNMAV